MVEAPCGCDQPALRGRVRHVAQAQVLGQPRPGPEPALPRCAVRLPALPGQLRHRAADVEAPAAEGVGGGDHRRRGVAVHHPGVRRDQRPARQPPALVRGALQRADQVGGHVRAQPGQQRHRGAVGVPAGDRGVVPVPGRDPVHGAVEPGVPAVGVAERHRVEQHVVERGIQDGALAGAAAGDGDPAQLPLPGRGGRVAQAAEGPARRRVGQVAAGAAEVDEGHADLGPDGAAGAEGHPAPDLRPGHRAGAARGRTPGAAPGHRAVEAVEHVHAVVARGAAEPATGRAHGDLSGAREGHRRPLDAGQAAGRLDEQPGPRAGREGERGQPGAVGGGEGRRHPVVERGAVPPRAGVLPAQADGRGRGGVRHRPGHREQRHVAERRAADAREVGRGEAAQERVVGGVPGRGRGRPPADAVGGGVRAQLHHAERPGRRGGGVAAEPRRPPTGADERVDVGDAGPRGGRTRGGRARETAASAAAGVVRAAALTRRA